MFQCESEQPKVSVIVITYNQEDTIGRTLDSILEQQTDFPFEIELADDCSTDRTSEVCRAYAIQYPDCIRYTRNKVNLGVRENYFAALRRCKADYIADCAGDDYWVDPYKLQKEADLLDAHPEVGLVHTDFQYVNEANGHVMANSDVEENKPYLREFIPPGELVLPLTRLKMLIHLCTALYRKDVFLRAEQEHPYVFGNPDITLEDFQLSVIYAHETSVAYIPDVTLHYTLGHESESHTNCSLRSFDFIFALLRMCRYFEIAYNLDAEWMAQVYDEKARFLMTAAFIQQDGVRMNALKDFYEENKIVLPWRSRLLLWLSRSKYLWRISAGVKKAHYEWVMKQWS